MPAWRIDGTFSRMMFAKTGHAHPEFADLGGPPAQAATGMNSRAKRFPNSPSWISSGLPDRGLNGIRRFAEFSCRLSRHRDTRAGWLDLRNKIAAFRLFQGRDQEGRAMRPETILGLDVYRRLFAAEGWSHRNAQPGKTARELSLPSFSPVSVHAGVGLRLAEPALARIHAGESEEAPLTEFLAACRRDAVGGCAGIMEEELGLLARTLYPHLVRRIDAGLAEIDETARHRFWHGAGRGIYFAPGNLPPFRAAPWRGLKMCMSEPQHEAGRRNAISGFCFALTMVNLLQPEVLDALFRRHATQAVTLMDGIRSAIAVWHLSGGEAATTEQIARYEPDAPTARVLWPLLWPGRAESEDRDRPERLFSAR